VACSLWELSAGTFFQICKKRMDVRWCVIPDQRKRFTRHKTKQSFQRLQGSRAHPLGHVAFRSKSTQQPVSTLPFTFLLIPSCVLPVYAPASACRRVMPVFGLIQRKKCACAPTRCPSVVERLCSFTLWLGFRRHDPVPALFQVAACIVPFRSVQGRRADAAGAAGHSRLVFSKSF
jgi:hypothetical protein